MSYQFKKTLDIQFNEAIPKVKEALEQEGFGVLTEIDVKKTLKEKLNLNYDNYTIMGVCNPEFAHKALQTEKEIGLVMPCNVIIYEQDNKTIVSAINPMKAMSIVENKELKGIAEEVGEKLKRVIGSLNEIGVHK